MVRSFDTKTTFLTSESAFLRRIGQTDFYANTYFEYDPDGNVNKITDPNWHSSSFTYNALAHPGLAAGGKLLLSYNVNGDGALEDPSVYRPRFVSVDAP